jgi:hypothetical protein
VLTILAFRHLLVRKRRSLFLLFGFSLGVGVMIVLLSVGEAMLAQSRDVSLVGGGEVTVLPQGIDVEAMRTGGIGGMFFGIDRARFLTRQVLGGIRQRDLVRAVSPVLEGKLVYLRHGNRVVPVRAAGEIPSRAGAVGAGLELMAGSWKDSRADSQYIEPTAQELYDELDRFHLPTRPDSTWAEWHYFNAVVAPNEWWYITYLIGGEVSRKQPPVSEPRQHDDQASRWGGQILLTHRRPDGKYDRFITQHSSKSIVLDTSRADLSIGESFVRQRNGRYRIHGRAVGEAGVVRIDLWLSPAPNRYFPPFELRDDELVSGYVVPGLVAKASGRVCVGTRCRSFLDIPAYHDHNWGIWRDVTWEWGAAQGSRLALLYGGVYGPERSNAANGSSVHSPFFLAAVDSLGVMQVLRFDKIDYYGSRPAAGESRFTSPQRFDLLAMRELDTVRLSVNVQDALATHTATDGFHRGFLQMRGKFTLSGRLLGQSVADSGMGFFETYVTR